MIDDLLDVTRIAHGKLSLEHEVIPVEGLIDTALNICHPDLEGRRLEIVRDLHAPTARVEGDSARLTQVFWNLLKNAIKFTPDGGMITIRDRVSPAGEPGEVVIEVEDTGCGIEVEALPRIFSAFDQGGSETTRRFGGLGLGLAISRAIVRAHHGRLEVASSGPGRGSVFTVTLPLARHESSAGSPGGHGFGTFGEVHAAMPPRRILLVEDHADTGRILSRLLCAWGHTVFHAKTVAEALQMAATEMATRGLDFIISDVGLPDGSGLDLMKQLAGRYSLSGIALSGYGMESDIQQSLAAGFVRHLTKPVDLNQLRSAVEELIAARP
ncbi:MAG TPA: ATP-binding protein [Lacunisphaera sp.]|nr:ATP-binding protein [Lacunisphaera sp.]